MAARRRRKWLLVLGMIILVPVALLLTLPFWLPWALRPLLERHDVRYAEFQRQGYARFALIHVTFARDGTEFKAGRIEVVSPTAWLWKVFATADTQSNFVRVTDWELLLPERSQPTPRTSTHQRVTQVDSFLPTMKRWLPRADLRNGVVRFGGQQIKIPSAAWIHGVFSTRLALPDHDQTALIEADLRDAAFWELSLTTRPLEFSANLRLAQDAGSLQLNGTALWRTNQANFTAQFDREGSLPATATVRSDSFRVPADLLNLRGYHDLAGSLSANWREERFTLNLLATAAPVENDPQRFPVEAALRVTGNLSALRVETLDITFPWLTANLSEPVELDYSGRLVSGQPILRVAADLGNQPWFDLTGLIRGEASLEPLPRTYPKTIFAFSGTELSGFGFDINSAAISGTLVWPRLEIIRARAELPGANLEGRVVLDAQERTIAEGALQATGRIPADILPEGFACEQAAVAVEFSGPFTNLAHAGQAAIEGAIVPRLAPLHIQASWRGTDRRLDALEADVSAGKSVLRVAASGEFATNRVEVLLSELLLEQGAQPVLQLEEPVALSVRQIASARQKPEWSLRLPGLRWSGSERSLHAHGEIAWPRRGDVATTARNVDLPIFQDFFAEPLPPVHVSRLEFTSAWTNSPATFALELAGRMTAEQHLPFDIQIDASGAAEGISLGRIVVTGRVGNILAGSGFLPIAIEPAHPGRWLQIVQTAPIDLQASLEPNVAFWKEVAEWTGLELDNPDLDLVLAGTFSAPRGRLVFSADALEFQAKRFRWPAPRLEKVIADISLETNRVLLNSLTFLAEKQRVQAAAAAPIVADAATWREALDWRNAQGRLRIPSAQIAAFTALAPEFLSPRGTLRLDLSLLPGLRVEGELLVADAATRPQPPLGAVQDLQAHIRFVERRAEIRQMRGLWGGQPFAVSGQAALREPGATNELPLIDLRVRGTNLPLVRQPDVILRSDLDLTISNMTNDVPVISGTVDLRDSFFLRDVRLLVPGRVAAPERRPPYFSVKTEPFRDWRLDLRVRGNRFLRVRTPVFRGEVSTTLRLERTLLEPIALGEVRINSGRVLFPFAALDVIQGMVSLTMADPFRPQMFITASGRSFGYEVRMELSGPADDPVLEFSSTPPLGSEQILLMITAGDLPGEERHLTPEQRASRLATYLGRTLLHRLGVEPGDERLTLRTGEISEEGRQTYQMEYKLNDPFSIVGEYDRFNDFNVGLKWKIYSR